MRTGLVTLWLVSSTWLVACGPAVAPKPPSAFGEDLPTDRDVTPSTVLAGGPSTGSATAHAEVTPDKPSVAPSAAREGTIGRDRLVAVLDDGPGAFLRQVEVSAMLDGERFIGWQLIQLVDHDGPLGSVDVAPGDILLAVNGKPVGKPDELHALWESLRTTNQIVAELRRGRGKVKLVFDVEPKI